MQEIRVKSTKRFFEEIDICHKRYQNFGSEFIFRGQGDAKWPLLPKVMRREVTLPGNYADRSSPYFSNREQVAAEFEILQSFIYAANDVETLPSDFGISTQSYNMGQVQLKTRIGRSEIPWPPLICHTQLAMAQHHGLPTRFIDWTYDPYVATYFAAKDCLKRTQNRTKNSPKDFAVFALNVEGRGFKGYGFENDVMDKVLEPHPEWLYQLVKTPSSFSINMRAQKGVFLTYVQKNFSPNEPFVARSVEEYVASIHEPEALVKIVLSSKYAPEIMEFLSKKFYSAKSLFPTLDGCVESLYEHDQWFKILNRA